VAPTALERLKAQAVPAALAALAALPGLASVRVTATMLAAALALELEPVLVTAPACAGHSPGRAAGLG